MGRSRTVAFGALVIGLLLSMVHPAPATAADGDVTVTGTVTVESGSAVSGVRVEISETGGPVIESTVTDSHGAYSLSVPPGTYAMAFIPPADSGFRRTDLAGEVIESDRTINLVLAPETHPVTLSGVARDGAGSPLPGLPVTIAAAGGVRSGTTAAADGSYSVTVPNGTYTLVLGDPEDRLPILPGGLDELSASGLLLDADRVLDITLPAGALDVVVVNPAGDPVADARVSLGEYQIDPVPLAPGVALTGGLRGSGVTGSDGRARLAVFPGSETALRVEPPPDSGLRAADVSTGGPITGSSTVVVRYSPGDILDATPPTVTGTPDRPPNEAGWYNSSVVITWSVVDPSPSSGLPTTPVPAVIEDEGRDTAVTSEPSCDPAGNCATGGVVISLDSTVPSVTMITPANTPASAASPIRGSATDSLSRMAAVSVVFRPVAPAGEDIVVHGTLDCETSTGNCSWTAIPPSAAGRYEVQASAIDVASNLATTEWRTVFVTARPAQSSRG